MSQQSIESETIVPTFWCKKQKHFFLTQSMNREGFLAVRAETKFSSNKSEFIRCHRHSILYY